MTDDQTDLLLSIDDAIARFNEKHDLDADQQFRQLVEEVGELAEALNRRDEHAAIHECADVAFVAQSISLLSGGQAMGELRETVEWNLRKSTETDGDKVTDDA